MSVLYLAVPVALGLVAFFVWAFVRSVRSGAYDDLETPAMRVLADDDAPPPRAPARTSPQPKASPADRGP